MKNVASRDNPAFKAIARLATSVVRVWLKSGGAVSRDLAAHSVSDQPRANRARTPASRRPSSTVNPATASVFAAPATHS